MVDLCNGANQCKAYFLALSICALDDIYTYRFLYLYCRICKTQYMRDDVPRATGTVVAWDSWVHYPTQPPPLSHLHLLEMKFHLA